MTYQTVPTVVTGDMWTAAQNNTYIRDNLAALWPYTEANTIAYATSSTVITKSNAPTVDNSVLYVKSGVPTWDFDIPKFCYLERTTNKSVSNSTPLDFDSEVFDNDSFFNYATSHTNITLARIGIYRFDGRISYGTGGTQTYDLGISFYESPTSSILICTQRDGFFRNVMSFSYAYKNTTAGRTITFRTYSEDTTVDLLSIYSIGITYLGGA